MPDAEYSHFGDRITWTNGTGNTVPAGSVVSLSSGATGRIGIALVTIPNGATGELRVKRVFKMKKATGEAFTNGQLVHWHTTNGLVANASGNTRAGRVTVPAASAATVAYVDINQP